MKQKLNILFTTLLLVALSACSTKQPDTLPPAFRHYLSLFKPLQLPLTLNIDTINAKLPENEPRIMDKAYLDKNLVYVNCYGMLPDTTNYYAVIVLAPADVMVPMLITYDKTGKRISMEGIGAVRGCGGGPGIDYCSSGGIISKDLSIYIADTINEVEMADGNPAHPIESTRQYYCLYKTGKVDANGKITMSAEQKKNISLPFHKKPL